MQFTKEQIQMIRNQCQTLEQTGKISDQLLTFIYDHKLFKLVVPKQFGGKMLDLPDAVNVFQQASFIDGNFGWLVTIGSGGGMFVPNMKNETVDRCYSPSQAVIAGSGYPAGKARRVQDGYMVSGQWLYCSGSQYATTFTITCTVTGDGENDNDILAFALRPEQVNVLNDWNAFGLQDTSSHSIEVKEQFVPEENAFSVFHIQNSYGGHVHTFPFLAFSEASFTAICLGISDHFLKEIETIITGQERRLQGSLTDRHMFLKKKLAVEIKRWEYVNDLFHKTLRSIWEEHLKTGTVSEEAQHHFSHVIKRVVSTTIDCTQNLLRYIGMQIIMRDSTINQIWRDLHTAAQHTFLIPDNEKDATPY